MVLTKNLDLIGTLNAGILQQMANLRQEEPRLPHISLGYAIYDPKTNNAQDAINEADANMYAYKQVHR